MEIYFVFIRLFDDTFVSPNLRPIPKPKRKAKPKEVKPKLRCCAKRPLLTPEERQERQAARAKAYRLENLERYNKKQSESYQRTKHKILERSKEYGQTNKEKTKKHVDRITTKIKRNSEKR